MQRSAAGHVMPPACSMQRRQTTSSAAASWFQRSRVHRQLQQYRLRTRNVDARPARFADPSHTAYYEPVVAGSKKGKVGKRIKEQRNRLRELSRQLAEQPMQPSSDSLALMVQELQAMSESLLDVSKVHPFRAECVSLSFASATWPPIGETLARAQQHQRSRKTPVLRLSTTGGRELLVFQQQ